MDLNSVRMFVAVVSKGSFSSASKALGTPIGTVSRRISELERDLGVRLLERSTRRLRLTESGAVLYEYSTKGIQDLEAGLLALNNQQKNLVGRLRLSIPPSFEPLWKVLSDFQDIYKKIELDLFVTERKLDFIEDGIDLALRIGEPESLSATLKKITIYRHKLVASQKYLVKNKKIKTPLDLIDHPVAAWTPKGEPIEWQLGQQSIKVSPKVRSNDYAQMKYLALSSKYITELPPFFCTGSIEQGKLVEILPQYPFPEQQVSFVFPSTRLISRITRAFLDFAVANLKI